MKEYKTVCTLGKKAIEDLIKQAIKEKLPYAVSTEELRVKFKIGPGMKIPMGLAEVEVLRELA